MKRRVVVDGHPAEIELQQDRETFDFRFRREDGEIVEGPVSAIEAEAGLYSVLMDGRSYEVKVVPDGDVYSVHLQGRRYVVEVFDPRDVSPTRNSIAGEGRQNVEAPMPGKIIHVLVREGDQVEAGQGLLVVEAMKMQNEMTAPKAGRVVLLAVEPGATVGAGEVLAAIE